MLVRKLAAVVVSHAGELGGDVPERGAAAAAKLPERRRRRMERIKKRRNGADPGVHRSHSTSRPPTSAIQQHDERSQKRGQETAS